MIKDNCSINLLYTKYFCSVIICPARGRCSYSLKLSNKTVCTFLPKEHIGVLYSYPLPCFFICRTLFIACEPNGKKELLIYVGAAF